MAGLFAESASLGGNYRGEGRFKPPVRKEQ